MTTHNPPRCIHCDVADLLAQLGQEVYGNGAFVCLKLLELCIDIATSAPDQKTCDQTVDLLRDKLEYWRKETITGMWKNAPIGSSEMRRH